MNKLGIVLGAAAVASLAGCKDPDYKYDNASSSQGEVKVVESTQPQDVRPIEVRDIEHRPASSGSQSGYAKPVTITADVSKPVPAETVPGEAPAAASTAAAVAAAAAGETTVYVVQSGDYLAKISKKYNVTISAIKRLNPEIKGDTIRIGQKIKLPGKIDVGVQAAPVAAAATKKVVATGPYVGATKEYVVKSGDSLGVIARNNGISVRQLKDLNSLKKDTIRVGQKLKVPAEKVVAKAATPAKAAPAKKAAAPKVAAPVATAQPVVEAKPADAQPAPAVAAEAAKAADDKPAETEAEKPAAAADAASTAATTATYVVQEGDDMTGVSIRWGVSAAAIRELNNLSDGDQLKPGQVIKLPADAQQ